MANTERQRQIDSLKDGETEDVRVLEDARVLGGVRVLEDMRFRSMCECWCMREIRRKCEFRRKR